MDLIKPESTYARPIPHRSLEACIHLKDIIITATTSQNIINEKLVSIIKPNSVIYSIGHGEISTGALKKLNERPDIKICRIDIGLSLIKYVERLVFEKETTPKVKQINKGRIISGGFLGMPGDIVVDNVDDPGLIYGYISNKNWNGFISINNLTNTKYFDNIRINAFGSRYYEPAPGLNFMLGIRK